ncbi:zinc metalloprotease [Corynebacterium bouchesdurhonense]|uniref:hypothetical protein n=1 Tax=Corynebacterium bouchesdurhonense TaxID=1720192 RepID=UPI000830E84E|nr:hypothetical protein [Corynebacterium bouchesdurhonense]
MRTSKFIVALAASLAVVSGSVAVPVANAAVSINATAANVTQDVENGGAFTGFDLTEKQWNKLRYADPLSVPGLMELGFQTSVYAGGGFENFTSNTTVSNPDGNTVVFTTDHGDGRRIVRTFEFNGPQATVTVEAEAPGYIQIDLINSFQDTSLYDVSHDANANSYRMVPRGVGYEVGLEFENAKKSGYADAFDNALEPTPGQSKYQQGLWSGRDRVTAVATLTVATQESAADFDRDGLPDTWEEEGVTIDGVTYDLPRWGAKTGQKDLFLQLEWMKSEWETAGCAKKERPIDQAACGRKDTTSFRPQRSTLVELEELFAAHGVALHIDAGNLYAPDFNLNETKGGATLDYQQYPFDNGYDLSARQNEFGSRANIFRRGIIGGQMEAGPVERARSGRGQRAIDSKVGGVAFYVAKLPQMNETHVRNTILHELGHTLGLDHDGFPTVESAKNPDRNYVPGYRSTMNYLYQMDKEHGFKYTKESAISGPRSKESLARELPRCAEENCYAGAYNIPADWTSLSLRNPALGKSAGLVGVPEASLVEVTEDRSVRDLEIIAAESNNGVGGLSNDESGPGGNTVTVGNEQNSMRMIVDNKGIDPHEFTLKAQWATGSYETKVPTTGILGDSFAQSIDVPLGPLNGYSKNTMPVTFTLLNASRELQSRQTIEIPVIRVTREEAQAVLNEAAAAPDSVVPTEVKNDLKVNLEPLIVLPTSTVPASPAPSGTTSSTPTPATSKPTTSRAVTPTPAPTTKPTTPTTVPTAVTSTASPSSPRTTATTAPSTVPTPTPSTPTPIPTRTSNSNPPRPQTGNAASGSSAGLFIGLLLAIGGAVAAIIGWLFNQGYVPMPGK